MKRKSAKLHFKNKIRRYTFVVMTLVFSLFCISLVGGSSTAKAYTTLDPLQAQVCLTGGCVSSLQVGVNQTAAFEAGGNGTGVIPYVESLLTGTDTATTAAIASDSGATALGATAAGFGLSVAPVTIAALGGTALVLTATAIEKKYHVGSSIGSYFADYVFGDTQSYAGGFTSAQWTAVTLVNNLGTGTGGVVSQWKTTANGVQSSFYTNCNNTAGGPGYCGAIQSPSPYTQETYIAGHTTQAAYGTEAIVKVGAVSTGPDEYFCTNSTSSVVHLESQAQCNTDGLTAWQQLVYTRYMTVQQYDTVMAPKISPWLNQSVDGSMPWPNLTTGAGMEPATGKQPVASPTTLGTSDPTAYCGGTGVLACPNPNVIPFTLNIASQNQLRCAADPQGYNCPAQSGGPNSTFTNTGGPATHNYVVPGCEGLSIADCEALLNSAALKNNWAAPAFTVITAPITSANPAYQPGAVISTSPEGGATVSANTDFTVTTNPSTLPVILPLPRP